MVLPALAVPVLGWSALATGVGVGGTALIGTNDDWKKGLKLDPASRIQHEEFDRTTGQIKDYSPMDYLGSVLLGQDLRQLNEAAQKKSDHDLVNNTYSEEVSGLRQGMSALGIVDPDALTPGKRQSATDFGESLAMKTGILKRLRELKNAGVPNEKLSELTKGGFTTLTLDALDSAANDWERDPRNITSATNTAQRAINADTRTNERLDAQEGRLASAQEKANTLATRQQEQSEYQFDQNQRERAHNAEMARLDRKADRSDKKELFALQMQQNNLDRAYMRERDERADERADRDKRTAMLLQMVQGLSKLGYGMAI